MNFLTLQIKLETLYDKNQQTKRITEEFLKHPELRDIAIEAEIPYQFVVDLLVHMSIHRQATIETMVGILDHHFQNPQFTADMIYKAAEVDLIDWIPAIQKLQCIYELSSEMQEDLNRYMYPPPMVIPPREVTNNMENGYYMTSGSLILKNNHHDYDICLDHINRLNKVKLRTNPDIAYNIPNQWKGVNMRKPGEPYSEYVQRRETFKKFNRISLDYIKLVTELDNEIWVTHKYCKRGRTYCQGYHINYQGNSWCKAVIEFAEGEITTA